MVVKACLHRLRISEVPIVLHPDGRDRPPHLRSFRDGWRHLCFLLLLCPLWLYMIPAGLLLAVGLSLMTWLTPGPQRVGRVVFDCHTLLLGSMCVVLGYQLLWLGVCANVFGRSSGLLPKAGGPPNGVDHLHLDRCLLGGLTLIALDWYSTCGWFTPGMKRTGARWSCSSPCVTPYGVSRAWF